VLPQEEHDILRLCRGLAVKMWELLHNGQDPLDFSQYGERYGDLAVCALGGLQEHALD
jgi:hypothetical protein